MLVAVVGVVDYLSGYTIFFSAFYLLPVALAAWFLSGDILELAVSILSVAAWLVGDIARRGTIFERVCDPFGTGRAIGLMVYFVVVKTLTSLKKLHNELEERVRQRTIAIDQ